MRSVHNITFYGYNAKEEVAKFEAPMTVEALAHFTGASVRDFIVFNHPKGKDLTITNAFASIGGVLYNEWDQVEIDFDKEVA